MTQADEYLLLKDLCARLPYGVICKSVNFKDSTKLVSIDLDGQSHDVYFCTNDGGSMWNDYDDIKPYLFPLSSMTEEQKYTCPIGVGELDIFIENANWSIMQIMPDNIIPFFDWPTKTISIIEVLFLWDWQTMRQTKIFISYGL